MPQQPDLTVSQPSYEVIRDAYGVPHLRAASVPDLAFAQGYETVRDRAWQLEIERLRGEGRVGALVGASGVEWDVFALRSRLDETARRAYDALSEQTRGWVAAYVAGVDAAYADGLSAPELRERRAAVRPWSPWTPLSIFLVQHILFGSYPSKLWRRMVHDALGDEGLALLRTEAGADSGSNAFGVGGARTVGGAPIVAGDPHRVFEAPNVYAQVHLACPSFDVAGYAFPGVPGVQHFAHAGEVAWAVTNASADYQDLYDERLERRGDEVWASGPDGEEPVRRSVERVDVRDGEPVDVEVLVTERGPVILGGPDEGTAISLGTPTFVDGDLGFEALLPLLHARSVTDVEAALEHWVEPVNNVVIADRAGTLVHRVAGRVPDRSVANRVMPVPADEPESRWHGTVSDLPRFTSASDGRLVTANDRIDDSYDRISSDFAAPYRADRLGALVQGTDRLDAPGAVAALMDVQQTQGTQLLTLIEEQDDLDEAPAWVRERLLAWDRRMSGDSVDAGLFVAVRQQVVDRICAAPALAPLLDPLRFGALYAPWCSLPARVASALPRLLAAERPFGIDVVAVVRDALAAVAADSPLPRTWGDQHRFRPWHALETFGLPHELGAPAGEPLGGDSDCVRCTGWWPGTETATRGSVARYAWDLADRDASLWVVPLGAHGDLDHAHGADQFDAWTTGAVPLTTDWATLEREQQR
ncbi:penicillin acylase family protein [Luteipulveratus sp. YIM 133132]|uniref:penicillin acylase family protein n=1 Tax=Luteipulveratus flavus TaxID=3031728 RepID=UPI0023AF1FF7|nr:penicillin acylase family protein [Luteipulveratus sp. YIM 133132]MDE9364911.1 penicillin acylase family protein [Luteipulveratus sp. YIM 133132]